MRAAAAAIAALPALAALSPAVRAEQATGGTYVSDPAEQVELTELAEPALREPMRVALGFDVGVGLIGIAGEPFGEARGGVIANLHAGLLVMPRLAVMLESTSVVHVLPVDVPEERGLLVHSLLTVAGRVWFTPTFWTQVGGGPGLLAVTLSQDDEATFGPGLSLAIGGEVAHRPDRAIDLAVRLALGRYEIDPDRETFYNVAASVGWHWY